MLFDPDVRGQVYQDVVRLSQERHVFNVVGEFGVHFTEMCFFCRLLPFSGIGEMEEIPSHYKRLNRSERIQRLYIAAQAVRPGGLAPTTEAMLASDHTQLLLFRWMRIVDFQPVVHRDTFVEVFQALYAAFLLPQCAMESSIPKHFAQQDWEETQKLGNSVVVTTQATSPPRRRG
eukprot:PhF_6_TR1060/c0_g1_i1/m.2220